VTWQQTLELGKMRLVTVGSAVQFWVALSSKVHEFIGRNYYTNYGSKFSRKVWEFAAWL